jgi:hypothetical protein
MDDPHPRGGRSGLLVAQYAQLVGLSAEACIILHNSYKIEYSSIDVKHILLVLSWCYLPVKNIFSIYIYIISQFIKYVSILLIAQLIPC